MVRSFVFFRFRSLPFRTYFPVSRIVLGLFSYFSLVNARFSYLSTELSFDRCRCESQKGCKRARTNGLRTAAAAANGWNAYPMLLSLRAYVEDRSNVLRGTRQDEIAARVQPLFGISRIIAGNDSPMRLKLLSDFRRFSTRKKNGRYPATRVSFRLVAESIGDSSAKISATFEISVLFVGPYLEIARNEPSIAL